MESRKSEGYFKNLEDFARRSGGAAGNRRVLESLIKVGALDQFGRRGQLLASLDSLVSLVQRETQLKESGQTNMFNLFGESVPPPMVGVTLSDSEEPSTIEQALWERELMGVSLSSQILESIAPNVPEGAVISKSQLEVGMKVALVGQVSNTRLQSDKNGDRIAFVTLELMDGPLDVAVWSRTYQTTSDVWVQGNLVHLNGTIRTRNDELTMHCDGASIYEIPPDRPVPLAEVLPEPKIVEWTDNDIIPDYPSPPVPSSANPPAEQESIEAIEVDNKTHSSAVNQVKTPTSNNQPILNDQNGSSHHNGSIPEPAVRAPKTPENQNIKVSTEAKNLSLIHI